MGVYSIFDIEFWNGGSRVAMRSSGLAGFSEPMRLRIQSRDNIKNLENRFPWHPWRGARARPTSTVCAFSSLSLLTKNQNPESPIGPSHV